MMKAIWLVTFFTACTSWSVASLRADQVVLQNGDTLSGKVLSVTTNALVLQNDNLGRLTLPRTKVTGIILGTGTAAGSLPAASPANIPIRPPVASQTNSVSDLSISLRGIRDQTNLVQQVQSQILGSASPDAINKYNELLDGLSTGKMGLNDLRQQAQSAADQLRSLKKDLGPDASGEADSYLAILDDFLQETTPVNVATNSSNAAPKVKPDTGQVGP
jgi:hypothetical protein